MWGSQRRWATEQRAYEDHRTHSSTQTKLIEVYKLNIRNVPRSDYVSARDANELRETGPPIDLNDKYASSKYWPTNSLTMKALVGFIHPR